MCLGMNNVWTCSYSTVIPSKQILGWSNRNHSLSIKISEIHWILDRTTLKYLTDFQNLRLAVDHFEQFHRLIEEPARMESMKRKIRTAFAPHRPLRPEADYPVLIVIEIGQDFG